MIAGLIVATLITLTLFLVVAILVRYFQATADIRKLLREVQAIRDVVESDYDEKYRKPKPAITHQLGPAPPTVQN